MSQSRDVILGGEFVTSVGSSAAGENHLFFEEIAPKTNSFTNLQFSLRWWGHGTTDAWPWFVNMCSYSNSRSRFCWIFFCCLLWPFESVSVFPSLFNAIAGLVFSLLNLGPLRLPQSPFQLWNPELQPNRYMMIYDDIWI